LTKNGLIEEILGQIFLMLFMQNQLILFSKSVYLAQFIEVPTTSCIGLNGQKLKK